MIGAGGRAVSLLHMSISFLTLLHLVSYLPPSPFPLPALMLLAFPLCRERVLEGDPHVRRRHELYLRIRLTMSRPPRR